MIINRIRKNQPSTVTYPAVKPSQGYSINLSLSRLFAIMPTDSNGNKNCSNMVLLSHLNPNIPALLTSRAKDIQTNCEDCQNSSNCEDSARLKSCSNCVGCEDCCMSSLPSLEVICSSHRLAHSSNLTDCTDCHHCSNCTDCSGLDHASNQHGVHKEREGELKI
jgi:hypothetical protein